MADEHVLLNRRILLRGAAGTAAGVGVAVSTPVRDAKAYVPPGDETRARYRETEDVKAFYRTNRYETKNKT
ncbi:MAG: formate dehydrogenase [Beijerinckiaceae bacterium]